MKFRLFQRWERASSFGFSALLTTRYILIFYDVIPTYFPDNVTFYESYQVDVKDTKN